MNFSSLRSNSNTVRPLFRLESNFMFLEYVCLSFNLPLSPLLKYTADKPLNAFLPPPLPFLFCTGGCGSLFKIKSNVIIVTNSLWESHYHHKQGQGEEMVFGRGEGVGGRDVGACYSSKTHLIFLMIIIAILLLIIIIIAITITTMMVKLSS